LARAVAAVLPRYPLLNASLQGQEILVWEDVHLGIATSLDDQLIVPVIPKANSMHLEELVTALNDRVERARARRLTPAEMSGSTFTISNLGMFGVDRFTAIINPPETAILAAGKIGYVPAAVGMELAVRLGMNLTLSIDHRVVDGAYGARFLAELKTNLETPYLML
ncbi:MAG TPA: 2-oxo acid dehydrogenase subunit E2, partial [Anaerolineales bacterium]|nr:2-oxo acid dehydrogenase subunit E2 [Anaerolineales bacterium]